MTTNPEYALMAGYAYLDTRDRMNWFPIPQGWSEFNHQVKTSGFEAVSFQNIDNPDEIVISFAGTGPGLLPLNPDWWANLGLYTGIGSDQLREAALYYLQVREANPNATISFTGHSLGGGIAALLGVFFDEQAITFDPAPFGSSVGTSMRDDLVSYLNDHGYDNNAIYQLAPELLAFSNENLAARHANVSGLYVEGEILSEWFSSMIGAQTPLSHGPTDVSGSNLHASSLLAAFVENDAFRQVTFKLPDLLNMLFDSALYYHDPSDKENPERNFLEHLIRHEIGVQNSFAADAMLDRFTADMWKIAQDGGLSLANANISKMLTAFAMQKYYEEPASGADQGLELFSDVTGGIRFNRTEVSDTLEAAKGYKYFQEYVGSLSFGSNRDVLTEQAPNLLDWYIQAGTQAMNATAGDQRAFMLGGSGNDILTGAGGNDNLIWRQAA